MHEVNMQWKCLRDTIPFPNSVIMIGEIDISPISMGVVMARTLYYIEIALKNQASFLVAEQKEYNAFNGKDEKIVVQFQLTFQSKDNLERFIKDIAP